MLIAEYQSKNVPIQYGEIVPKGELVLTFILSKRISKKKNIGHAVNVLIFFDLMKFSCSKIKAQRILKDCLSKESQKMGSYLHQLTRNYRRLVICCSRAYTIVQNVLLLFDKLYYLAK
jgi:hypothetical protein